LFDGGLVFGETIEWPEPRMAFIERLFDGLPRLEQYQRLFRETIAQPAQFDGARGRLRKRDAAESLHYAIGCQRLTERLVALDFRQHRRHGLELSVDERGDDSEVARTR